MLTWRRALSHQTRSKGVGDLTPTPLVDPPVRAWYLGTLYGVNFVFMRDTTVPVTVY